MGWLGYLTWKNNTSARMANQASRVDGCPEQGGNLPIMRENVI